MPKIPSPWAVILCKFSDNGSEPFPRSFYDNLFTGAGAGTMNMVDFFADMSHGQIDLSGSKVFGWYTLSQKRADYTGGGPNPAGRQALVDWAKQSATSHGVTLADFFGVVVCMNVPTDLFGGGGRQAVCDNGSMQPSLLGQEMGHGYGLDHARANGSEADYQDPYDIMSTANAFETPSTAYTNIGPGLNAATMASQNWIDESRVWKSAGGDFDLTVPLRPLHRHNLPGFLAARIGPYLVEYRSRERWDNNGGFPVVLVHRFQNNHSYVMSSANGKQGLSVGDVFRLNRLTYVFQVDVVQIDDAQETAYVRLHYASLIIRRPTNDLMAGASVGGGSFLVMDGQIVPIPATSPAMALLEQAYIHHEPEALQGPGVREQVSQLEQLRQTQARENDRGGFRHPAIEKLPNP
jgi:hypothetical protein